VRNQRHLAEAGRALIGFEHPPQHRLSLRRVCLHHASGLEADPDAADQRALVGEGLGGGDGALDARAVRGGEDLLGRDIGDAVEAVAGRRAAAHPEVIVGEADAEIGSRAAEVKRTVALVVQLCGPLVQVPVVVAPGGDRVRPVDAGRGEDRLPEMGQRLLGRLVRKDGRRPGGRGRGDDGPVDGVAGNQLHGGPAGL